jgi:hypothetical protein
MKNVVFARIGYMKYYNGHQIDDEKPIGGGNYNKTDIGHEIYNFKNINGKLFGYFQPYSRKHINFENCEINLGRINPDYKDKDKIDNVLVIFFAKHPIENGQIIVGWYNNATVYRFFQEYRNEDRNNYAYNIETTKDNSTLLPLDRRTFHLGHGIKSEKEGNPGQSNIFYIYDNSGKIKDPVSSFNKWIFDSIKYVEEYSGNKISSIDDIIEEETKGQAMSFGFQNDIKTRLAIESYSMEKAKEYYQKNGFNVNDVSSKESYDLVVIKENISKKIEVKGLQGDLQQIILTKNEVAMANENPDMELFIVHSIEYDKEKGKIKKNSGIIKVISPWHIDNERLIPLQYLYRFK